MNPNQTKTAIIHQRSGDSGIWASLILTLLAVFFMPASTRAQNIYWALTNATASGNWSSGANWVGGSAPTTAQSAYFTGTNAQSFNITNDVAADNFGTTNIIQDLVFDLVTNSYAVGASEIKNLVITPGTTLAVTGPNGLIITRNAPVKDANTHNILGDTLVVNNPAASVILNSGQGANNTGAIISFAGLTNLNVAVNIFGASNGRLSGGPVVGDQGVKVTLARTNVILAGHKDDYTAADFTNSIELFRGDQASPTAATVGNSFFELGYSNLFLADSIGVGRGYCAASASLSFSTFNTLNGASTAGYQVSFANVNKGSSAVFRNTNGTDRVSLVALDVNSAGLTDTNKINGNRFGGNMNLQGGKVDMLVDQMWLARNYTNAITTKVMQAGFAFDNGIVDANTVIAGYMAYTNVSFCDGFLLVGSNAVMHVNDTLILGYTPTNYDSTYDTNDVVATAQANTFGQVQINSGSGVSGTLYANKIEVGLASTNNALVVNGSLVVSNTIADSSKPVDSLSVGATGQLTFTVAAGVTNAFVDTLTTASGAKINIASAPPVVGSYVLIHYANLANAGNYAFTVGTLPAGIGNASILDDGNGDIVLTTFIAPAKKLVWSGAQDSNWNHSSANWYDAVTGKNIAFTDGDAVTFDDTLGVPTTINVTEPVYPSQIGTGITVSNNVNSFVFANSGGSMFYATFSKSGAQDVEIDCPSTLSVKVNGGSLTGSGSAVNVTVATNANMNFAGTIAGTLSIAGSATVAAGGVVNGTVNVQSTGLATNNGTLNGSLSMSAGSTVVNTSSGLMTAIGNATINTNSTLINGGTIYGGAVTINLGGTWIDSVNGSTGFGPGSLNVVSLSVSGTFAPGANGIATTKVTDYNYQTGGPLLNPNGRVNLNAGSTTILNVDMDLVDGQTNTLVLSQNQGFGGSFGYKSFNGGTLMINNLGSKPFAAGQSFKFFGSYYANGDCQNAGANTTNTYPVIIPATPGPGLVWDLSQLIPQGYIGVLSATDPSRNFSITNSTYLVNTTGTNLQIVTQLELPTDQPNGWVQILNTSLTNGLSATNWVNVTQSTLANMPPNTYLVTNNITTNTATFYRFVTP